MPKSFIKMRDVMRSLFAGLPADLTFITFDRNRKTGGKVKKLKGCLLMCVEDEQGRDVIPNHIPEVLSTRKPNHHLHGTFNVRPQSGEPHKIRKIFITEFNGKEVVL
jgi:hypothetical protein